MGPALVINCAWHYAYDAAGHMISQTPPVNVMQGVTKLDITEWNYARTGAADC